jgi:hypothetical protein
MYALKLKCMYVCMYVHLHIRKPQIMFYFAYLFSSKAFHLSQDTKKDISTIRDVCILSRQAHPL